MRVTRRMVYKGFAEKCPVLKTLKFSIFSVLTTLITTLIFKDHFSKVDNGIPELIIFIAEISTYTRFHFGASFCVFCLSKIIKKSFPEGS